MMQPSYSVTFSAVSPFFQLTLVILLEFVFIALVHHLEKDLVVATLVLRPLCSAG